MGSDDLLSLKNMFFIASDERAGDAPRFRLITEVLFLALAGYAVASMFIAQTYHPLLFILAGLSVAATNIYVDSDSRHFDLFEKRDAVIGVLAMIAILIGFKLFLVFVGF